MKQPTPTLRVLLDDATTDGFAEVTPGEPGGARLDLDTVIALWSAHRADLAIHHVPAEEIGTHHVLAESESVVVLLGSYRYQVKTEGLVRPLCDAPGCTGDRIGADPLLMVCHDHLLHFTDRLDLSPSTLRELFRTRRVAWQKLIDAQRNWAEQTERDLVIRALDAQKKLDEMKAGAVVV